MADAATAFISRWSKASPSERANSQLFLSELCDLLGVPHPDPARDTGYGFEYEVTHHHPDGTTSQGRIDLYKGPVTPKTLAKRFKRADPATVAEILENLCTMGHAHRGKTKGTYLP